MYSVLYCTYLLRYVQCTVLTYCGLYSVLTLVVVPVRMLHDGKRKLQNTSIHVSIIEKQLGQLITQNTT